MPPEGRRSAPNQSRGYFSLGRRAGRWWFITPGGEAFFSLGLNHIDPASLRYSENIHIWRERYGGDTIRWIRESVSPNLRAWGFNTVGWVQEVTVRHWRHSRSFTAEEYGALAMPYCHLLPFTESHQWEQHTQHFDYLGSQWAEWVDYVARSHCAELADDPNLIGYFYSDCPTWAHDLPHNRWRGPLFDPELLASAAGRRQLRDLALAYYRTTSEAVRRHDPNHLILGDRFEANAPLPDEIVDSALPYVDVLSFQDFRAPAEHLGHWHGRTGKPVLLADAAGQGPVDDAGFVANDGRWYADVLTELRRNPGCVGFHLCGAYQRNRARRRGLLDEFEREDRENLARIATANRQAQRWMEELAGPGSGDG